MTFLEPSPMFLAFIFAQRFVFFEALAILALLRVIVGRGLSRIPAAVTLVLCLAAILTSFAPALNMQDQAYIPAAARWLAIGGGTVLPFIASAIFATSLLMPSRRWRWIDMVHLLGLAAYLGLWLFTRI